MDSIDLIAIKSDEKSTLKLKIAKRDEKGNAIKDENGNITYEEKDITSGEKNEITLNKIGEEDTQNNNSSYSRRHKSQKRIPYNNKKTIWNNKREHKNTANRINGNI